MAARGARSRAKGCGAWADSDDARISDFRGGLSEAGYVEGPSGVIEYRWVENKLDRLHELAGEFVRGQAGR